MCVCVCVCVNNNNNNNKYNKYCNCDVLIKWCYIRV